MRSRYSSWVVAPISRSSPRARAGLSRLAASSAPSALPAPTSVCSSSMNRMTVPLDALVSATTDFSRSSNSPRNLAPAISRPMSSAIRRLPSSGSGTWPRGDALREAFDDGGLADARLADQHRVVLGAAHQHLHQAQDLVLAADDRVELAVGGERGQVDAVLLERLEASPRRSGYRRCGHRGPRRRRAPARHGSGPPARRPGSARHADRRAGPAAGARCRRTGRRAAGRRCRAPDPALAWPAG